MYFQSLKAATKETSTLINALNNDNFYLDSQAWIPRIAINVILFF